ncbi:hypothetical protein [Streptomyces sp. NRRL F-5053]|uniref:hypothetical protein n=1 Tax=Streptomyces sp. NRRL F-5053 TaxID=1463854 RepID=UPI0004CB658A|nr:hypothetical protein [Streptomyces sp. NRRL F-5053]
MISTGIPADFGDAAAGDEPTYDLVICRDSRFVLHDRYDSPASRLRVLVQLLTTSDVVDGSIDIPRRHEILKLHQSRSAQWNTAPDAVVDAITELCRCWGVQIYRWTTPGPVDRLRGVHAGSASRVVFRDVLERLAARGIQSQADETTCTGRYVFADGSQLTWQTNQYDDRGYLAGYHQHERGGEHRYFNDGYQTSDVYELVNWITNIAYRRGIPGKPARQECTWIFSYARIRGLHPDIDHSGSIVSVTTSDYPTAERLARQLMSQRHGPTALDDYRCASVLRAPAHIGYPETEAASPSWNCVLRSMPPLAADPVPRGEEPEHHAVSLSQR